MTRRRRIHDAAGGATGWRPAAEGTAWQRVGGGKSPLPANQQMAASAADIEPKQQASADLPKAVAGKQSSASKPDKTNADTEAPRIVCFAEALIAPGAFEAEAPAIDTAEGEAVPAKDIEPTRAQDFEHNLPSPSSSALNLRSEAPPEAVGWLKTTTWRICQLARPWTNRFNVVEDRDLPMERILCKYGLPILCNAASSTLTDFDLDACTAKDWEREPKTQIESPKAADDERPPA
ncbi:hypothetical protein DCS_06846 [Drechmeria coniospora]|uniref:Uncharacterized protein n=1 Tax=Drechmeria coniospora TaxID=98403 RepID=A0A151GCV1_DRECN|nr:hypothetical protein DCS_06846 [Drechmeria coniospora]KYK54885.1 hypothetical protein DCS_06846 [Drechmeria coniospora]